jgi:hypothetical protein
MLRASALTFYTLLSVVPVFAVIFGIAKGFGLEKLLEKELLEQMTGQEQALERILAFSRNMLENTRGRTPSTGVSPPCRFSWSGCRPAGPSFFSALSCAMLFSTAGLTAGPPAAPRPHLPQRN